MELLDHGCNTFAESLGNCKWVYTQRRILFSIHPCISIASVSADSRHVTTGKDYPNLHLVCANKTNRRFYTHVIPDAGILENPNKGLSDVKITDSDLIFAIALPPGNTTPDRIKNDAGNSGSFKDVAFDGANFEPLTCVYRA